MKTKLLIGLMIGLLFINACVQTPPGAVSTPATQPVISANPSPTTLPEATHTAASLTPAQAAAIQAASDKYQVPASQITIISTEEVTWPDGCLGVVIPGVMCTQALVDGYRIILDANGEQLEYHTNLDGTNVVDAAQQLSSLGFVVRSADGSLQVVNPPIPLGPTHNPVFTGFNPLGGSINGTAYLLDLNNFKAVALDANGTRDLSFIQNPTYGLAVWRGGEGTSPMLAWGTQLFDDARASSLQISAPDGSGLETLLALDAGATPPQAIVAQAWSADGKEVYFSREPVGIGGYIPFSAASNLFKINISTKEVTELIPVAADTAPQVCLDAMSGDYRLVVDHCTSVEITIRDLQSGSTATLLPPADVTEYKLLGSARFSPDGSKVAFAMVEGNPDNEQGWVAVGDSAGGTATTILVGTPGSYYTIVGWLDDQTLLVQSTSLGCASCTNEVFTVGADGSNPTKVADGSLVAIIDDR